MDDQPSSVPPDTPSQEPELSAIDTAGDPKDEHADLPMTPREEQQAQVDYARRVMPPPKPKKNWPKWVALIIVVIVLAGAGAFVDGHKSSGSKTPAKKATTAQIAPTQTSSSSSTATYTAAGNDLNLSFSYPSDWTATPASGSDTTDQPITVTSPLVSITSAAGSSVTGKVIFTIRPGTATLSELGSATTAAQASVQYAYSKPASDQHNYFYLTFIHTAATINPAGSFNEVIVTGITTFNSGDSLTPDNVSVDPIISASFDSCTTNACSGSGAVPLSITNATWQNADIFTQTLTMIESMQLN
jgi:hypothetical protein